MRIRIGRIVVILMLGAANSAHADNPPTFGRMIIDGEYEDWAAVPVAFEDPAGDNANGAADFGRVWVANDDEYVYLRFEGGALTNLQTISGPLRIFFDVDRSPATGWAVGRMGSDFALLFPERYGIESTSDQWEAARLSHAELALVTAPTVAGTQFELRVRRDAVFPVRGTPILDGPDFDILLESQDTGGVTGDWAPDEGLPLTYKMASGSLVPYQAIPLERGHRRHVRLMSHNMLWDGLLLRPEPHDRLLRAIVPDIICYQEVQRGTAANAIQARLDEVLPLGGGASWHVYKADTNVIASRWPLSMQMRDTIPGTRRGQAMALVDLPDVLYDVDLYVISAHFKCCGNLGSSEDQRRQQQADANVNWFRDLREPGENVDLPAGTPFLICGDFNMVGGPQPLMTLVTGDIIDEAHYGADSPPDWDGSEMKDARPLHNAGPAAYTWRSDESTFGPSRMDFVIYADSVLTVARQYALNTLDMCVEELAAYGLRQDDTATASDHLPLVLDLDFCGQVVPADIDLDGQVNLTDFNRFAACYGLTESSDESCPPRDLLCSDLNGDGAVNMDDFYTLAVRYGQQGRR
ncbi:MAG: endonuclease/exonuclease/phosphatase family protein [Phycisphaerales bacterium]|nr:MAG: endonuclease/exonuclease/phosphatase family protein [Phycisphaerales bacterium]